MKFFFVWNQTHIVFISQLIFVVVCLCFYFFIFLIFEFLQLLAKPYFHHDERLNKIKAKSLIKQALKRDEYYLPAVYMLYDILQEEGDVAGAKKLIERQLAVQPNSKLFSMLGDLQSQEKDLTKAVENYTIAIK